MLTQISKFIKFLPKSAFKTPCIASSGLQGYFQQPDQPNYLNYKSARYFSNEKTDQTASDTQENVIVEDFVEFIQKEPEKDSYIDYEYTSKTIFKCALSEKAYKKPMLVI